MSASKALFLLAGAIIFILALTGINIYIAAQISSERSALNSQLAIASRQPPPIRSSSPPVYTSWVDSGDNPPHCWWYQFLAPIDTFCYQNDPKQPSYGMAFVMNLDYYASVNSQVPQTTLPTGNFPPLTGSFPAGSLKAQTITTNNSTIVVEGKVAGLVLKDGQLLLTFQDKTTDGVSSITVDSAKVNLTAIHVGSVIRASIITTTTANVYTTTVPFTLVTINDYQGICQWQTPYGTFSQNELSPPPSTACLRYTNIGGTIPPGGTFWTLSTTTKTTIEKFEVISK